MGGWRSSSLFLKNHCQILVQKGPTTAHEFIPIVAEFNFQNCSIVWLLSLSSSLLEGMLRRCEGSAACVGARSCAGAWLQFCLALPTSITA